MFFVCRWETPSGKEIRPLTLWKNKNGAVSWAWKHHPTPRPLYGLNRLAARPDAPIFITEGEKACDAAMTLFPGFVAVTSPGGCKAAEKADWRPLAGRRVVVSPDADEPGEAYGRTVARLVREAGAVSVERLILSEPEGGWPQGWDLADGLAEARTAESVREQARFEP
ncbi:MAG: DUF6371 domain-containing protein [Thermodesulfobacteriota bacterium]